MPHEPAPVAPTTTAQPPPVATPQATAEPGKPPGGDSGAVVDPAAPPAPAKAKDLAAVSRQGFKLREATRLAKQAAASAQSAFTQQLEPLRAQLGDLTKAQKEWQAERAAILADPVSWAEKNGRPAEQTISGYVAKGTPEEAIRLAREEAAAATAAAKELREALAKRDTDAAAEKEEGAKAARAAAEKGACVAFTRSVVAKAKTFPFINAMYSPEEIEAKAAQFQAIAAKEEWTDETGKKRVGKQYPFEEVAKAFEANAKAAHDKRQARLAELTSSQEEEPGTAPGVQAKPVPGNGRREGTNGPGTTRTALTPEKPKAKPRALTIAEQRKADLQMIQDAQRKDAQPRR